MSNDYQQFRREQLATRLMHIEVNMMLKENMSGLGPRSSRRLLIDIAKKYYEYLEREGYFGKVFKVYVLDVSGINAGNNNNHREALLPTLGYDDILLELIFDPKKDKTGKIVEAAPRIKNIFILENDYKQWQNLLPDQNGNKDPKPYSNTSELRENYAPIGSYASFNVIRMIACEALKDKPEDIKKVTLIRIKDNCDNIKMIFDAISHRKNRYKKDINFKDTQKHFKEHLNGNNDGPSILTRLIYNDLGIKEIAEIEEHLRHNKYIYEHERAMLRKIWDLGTEQIVMQTLIALDGDIVTRVSEDYLGDKYKQLYALHEKGISYSLQYWNMIISAAIQFFEWIFGQVTQRFSRPR